MEMEFAPKMEFVIVLMDFQANFVKKQNAQIIALQSNKESAINQKEFVYALIIILEFLVTYQ